MAEPKMNATWIGDGTDAKVVDAYGVQWRKDVERNVPIGAEDRVRENPEFKVVESGLTSQDMRVKVKQGIIDPPLAKPGDHEVRGRRMVRDR